MDITIRKNNDNIRIVENALAIFMFYFIFMPDFSGVIPFAKNSSILLMITIIAIIFGNRYFFLLMRDRLIWSSIKIICIASLYTFVITIVWEQNISSNLTAIFTPMKILIVGLVYEFLYYKGYSCKNMMDFLIKVANIQVCLCILMVIFPSLKVIANILYTSNIDNYASSALAGITKTRIYGIFGDYTYSGQVFMALMAAVSFCFYFSYKQNKYLVYCIFQLGASIINGRTGGLAFGVSLCIVGLSSIKRRVKLSTIKKVIIIFSIIMLFLCATLVNSTLNEWMLRFIKDLFEISQGTSKLYSNDYFLIPEGFALLFGEGHRVYGTYGLDTVGRMSDCGYVNDIFRGGILYCFFYYYSNIKLIFKNIQCEENKDIRACNKRLRLVFLIFLLIANYKGECMSGSSIICGIWFMSMAMKRSGTRC